MKIHLSQKITAVCLLCCILINLIPVKISAHEEEAADCVFRVYGYQDAEYMYGNVIEVQYPEIVGMEDKEYQEKMNCFIQQKALDDMFSGYLFDIKRAYPDQNELREPRTEFNARSVQWGTSYLFGDILSIFTYYADRERGIFPESGIWEPERGGQHFDICNFDVTTGEVVTLNEILVLDDNFLEILENMDITQYNDEQEALSYNGFMRDIGKTNVADCFEGSQYRWILDTQGNLGIHDLSWYTYSKIPLTLFRGIIRPEYEKYTKGYLPGYSFSSDNIDPSLNSAEKKIGEEPDFVKRTYQYEEDVKLEYFQITGMRDVSAQGDVNDYLLKTVLDTVIEDLSYFYLNSGCYDEMDERDSLIHVQSVMSNYDLNGSLLSFTQVEDVTRKAYVTKDGMEKEEKTKGPYLQAFNYDIEKGKELTLGDIFEADDEFFDIIENWRYEEYGISPWNWEDKTCVKNYILSIGLNFCTDMHLKKSREEFINGEVKYYHWFIDHDEEGNNLCIYRYYALDDEDQCFKIPLSILKDKLKPEYQDCFTRERSNR